MAKRASSRKVSTARPVEGSSNSHTASASTSISGHGYLPELDLAEGPLGDYGYDHVFSSDSPVDIETKEPAPSAPASVSHSDNSRVSSSFSHPITHHPLLSKSPSAPHPSWLDFTQLFITPSVGRQ